RLNRNSSVTDNSLKNTGPEAAQFGTKVPVKGAVLTPPPLSECVCVEGWAHHCLPSKSCASHTTAAREDAGHKGNTAPRAFRFRPECHIYNCPGPPTALTCRRPAGNLPPSAWLRPLFPSLLRLCNPNVRENS
ncbi:hypothetical protein STEG23_018293, partial [Scotinomys teguina]